jgi:GNAT superfamily N-acetyltransferase
MGTIAIRRGQPADAIALAQLRYEFRAGLDRATEPARSFAPRCADWMRRQLGSGTPWLCWVAQHREQVIGTVWLELIEKLPNPVGETERHGYITNLYVRAEHRGAGTGTRLLRAALSECDAQRVDAVLLWPTPRSRSLYEREGFRPASDLLERRRVMPPHAAVMSAPDPA